MLELKQWLASLEQWISSLNQEWSWVLQVFMIVLATAFVNFFAKRILAKGLQRLHRTDTQWDNILLEAMSRPLTWIVWLVGLSIASHVIYAETESSIFTATNLVRDVGILICFTWFLLNFIRAAERELSRDSDQIDKHTVVALGKLIRLAILITAGLVIMQKLGSALPAY